jgi:hypothetical protein
MILPLALVASQCFHGFVFSTWFGGRRSTIDTNTNDKKNASQLTSRITDSVHLWLRILKNITADAN